MLVRRLVRNPSTSYRRAARRREFIMFAVNSAQTRRRLPALLRVACARRWSHPRTHHFSRQHRLHRRSRCHIKRLSTEPRNGAPVSTAPPHEATHFSDGGVDAREQFGHAILLTQVEVNAISRDCRIQSPRRTVSSNASPIAGPTLCAVRARVRTPQLLPPPGMGPSWRPIRCG